MIINNQDLQNNLRSQKDRITELLSKNSKPSFGQEIGDISQAYLSSLSSNTGAAGFNQAHQGIQQQRMQQAQQELQNQMSLHNLMQEEVNQGNQDAIAVDKAIKDVVGNDVKTYEKIAREIHSSPEPANRANANLLVSSIAAKMGYKPFAQKVDETELAYKQAQANRLNAETAKARKELNAKPSAIGGYDQLPIDPVLARQADKDVILKNRETAKMASDSLRSIESIENALFNQKGQPKAKTGKGQAALQSVGRFLPGVDSSTYEDITAKSTKLSLDVASMLKGQTSDKDITRSLLTSPGYDKTPSANKRIIKDQKSALKVVAEMPKFTAQWRSKYGSTISLDEKGRTYDEAFLDWQSSRFKELGGAPQSEQNKNGGKFSNLSDDELLKQL